jgi:hypothetical protein
MISPRRLPRAEWETLLRNRYDCRKDDDESMPRLETAEFWCTSHGFVFVVPCDSEGYLRADDWQNVKVEIERLRPIDFDS